MTVIVIGIVGTIAITIMPLNIAIIAINALLFFPIIKRLHDMNISGGIGILVFIPGANIIMAIVLLFIKGTNGANKYGNDPISSVWKQQKTVSIKCPQCGEELYGATEEMIGDIEVCKKCKAEFTIRQDDEQETGSDKKNEN